MNIKAGWYKLKSILGLSLSLAKSYFKTRNEGSYLGIFWYLLNPLAFFVIIMVMSQVINAKPEQDYPLYLFLGLIMFNFFLNSTMSSVKSMANNSGFLKSIKTTQESFVIAIVLEFIFAHIFEIILFALFMVYFKVSLIGLMFYPIIFLFLLFFTLGMSFILATIGVYVSDFNNVWDVFGRLLWFITPIFYFAAPGTILYKFNLFNPLFYYITLARDIVIYQRFPGYFLTGTAIFIGLAVFFIGFIVFIKNKNKFAERV